MTNPLGQITTSVIDTTNRVAAVVDPLGDRVSMTYDFADDQVRMTNPLGFVTTGVFDKLLRPVDSVDPLLNRTTTTFDAGGRRIRIQDANGKITTTVHNSANRFLATLNAKASARPRSPTPPDELLSPGRQCASQQLRLRC